MAKPSEVVQQCHLPRSFPHINLTRALPIAVKFKRHFHITCNGVVMIARSQNENQESAQPITSMGKQHDYHLWEIINDYSMGREASTRALLNSHRWLKAAADRYEHGPLSSEQRRTLYGQYVDDTKVKTHERACI